MSAYLVDPEQIDAIVSAWIALARPGQGLNLYERMGQAQATGRMLWTENAKSVTYRYEGAACADIMATVEAYRFQRCDVSPATIAAAIPVLLKLLANYEYQACEHPGWDASEARKWCEHVRSEAIHALPGYAAAPWGTSDRNVFSKAGRS